MMVNRTLIVGDVHGCLNMLKRLMDLIRWDPASDRLIYVGDYIDRGEDIFGVVEFIVSQRRESDLVECLIGNHEVMLLDYIEGNNQGLFFFNGGASTIRSYRCNIRDPQGPLFPYHHMEFFKGLKPFCDLGTHLVVHAGFRPGVALSDQSLEDMVWIREEFIYSDFDFGRKIVFGHTPFRSPLVRDNKIGLDTGAVYGNKLTCLELPGEIFHQVPGSKCA
jgi:serine/threonine protein phosphatase 1